jgi:uncharacterized alkaline shock family protein YloU
MKCFNNCYAYSKMAVVKEQFPKGGKLMSIELKNAYGQIDISNDVIATIAGGAAVDCYGIVGMASKNQVKDGLSEILRKENFTRGVIVRQEEQQVHIDMYIIVSYGTKISEIAYNVQSKVQYTLDKTVGLAVDTVNIYVQGVRVTNP